MAYAHPAHPGIGGEVVRILVEQVGWLLEDDLKQSIVATVNMEAEAAILAALRSAGVIVHAHSTCHGHLVAAHAEDPGEGIESDVTCRRCLASMRALERAAGETE